MDYLLESQGVECTWLDAGGARSLALVHRDVLLAGADEDGILVVLV